MLLATMIGHMLEQIDSFGWPEILQIGAQLGDACAALVLIFVAREAYVSNQERKLIFFQRLLADRVAWIGEFKRGSDTGRRPLIRYWADVRTRLKKCESENEKQDYLKSCVQDHEIRQYISFMAGLENCLHGLRGKARRRLAKNQLEMALLVKDELVLCRKLLAVLQADEG